MSITNEDKLISLSRWLESALKIQILNEDETVLDELIGFDDMGSITTNAASYVRRTFSFTLFPTNQDINIGEQSRIWINKQAKVLLGLKTPRMSDFKWYPCGVFIFTDVSSAYNQEENSLTVNCSDRMAQLDGTANGEVSALKTSIPAYEIEFSSAWIEASATDDWEDIWNYGLTQNEPMYKDFTVEHQAELKEYFQILLYDYSDENSNKLIPFIQEIYEDYNCNITINVTSNQSGNNQTIISINAHNPIRDALISIITQLGNVKKFIVDDIGEYYGTIKNDDYITYRENHPLWNCIPYDLEYAASSNVGNIITELIELYPNYDAAFDEYGVLNIGMIPSCMDDEVVLTNDDIQEVLISESCTTNLSSVRNVVHVWGQTFDVDWYTDTIANENNVYTATIEKYLEYANGHLVALKIPETNSENQFININELGAFPIYDNSTDSPLEAETLSPDTYVFRFNRQRFYLQGQWQAHALSVLVDGEKSTELYTCSDGTETKKYSKKYFQDKYGAKTLSMKRLSDSPFTVQKIGERLSTKSGNIYDNISNDSLALIRSDDDLRKLAGLTDNVTIELSTLMPWLKEYMKLSYIKKNETELKQYITDSVTLNLSEGTTNITMHTFYPLYPS